MVQNTSQTVNDIAKHIGVVLSSELLDDIVKAVQFENLARGKYESEEFLRKEISPNFSIYRKGSFQFQPLLMLSYSISQ